MDGAGFVRANEAVRHILKRERERKVVAAVGKERKKERKKRGWKETWWKERKLPSFLPARDGERALLLEI